MLLLTVVCAIAGAQALTVKGAAVDQAKMNQFIDDLMGKMTLQEKIGQLNLPVTGDIITVSNPHQHLQTSVRLPACLN